MINIIGKIIEFIEYAEAYNYICTNKVWNDLAKLSGYRNHLIYRAIIEKMS